MKIETSNGELLDKLSILELKQKNISDDKKLANIKVEFEELNPLALIIFKENPPIISELYLKLSQINAKLWKIEDDIRQCEREKSFDSKFVQAYDNIGKAYRMLKKYDLAIISYEMSLKIFPKGVSAHQNLGVIYVEQKNWDKAIKEYKILIKLSPENAEGYYGLANIYQRTSKLKLALDCFVSYSYVPMRIASLSGVIIAPIKLSLIL